MPQPPPHLHLRAGVVDLPRRTIQRGGENVSLSTREVALLGYLAAREDQVVSRAELLTEVWAYRATAETRAVDVTMRRLREKVEVDPAEPDHLLTHHGDGYRFVAYQRAPAPPPPGPEVAFVFTDIQGSTAQWERLGSAYQRVIDQHAALVRDATVAHQGYEVKTAGDGFMLAFATAGQALSAAMAVQSELASADFGGLPAPLVRVGIHVGPAAGRVDPVTGRVDWFGPTVNRAARLMAAAHGGQAVVTEAVRMSAPVDVAWTLLGEHAFPGIVGTTRVWQALPHALAHRRFPALASIPRARLPAPADQFVGRVDELAEGLYNSMIADIDVYKAIHHGSKDGDAGNTPWLDLVMPENVVVPVGPNSYGHPTAEAMTTYAAYATSISRTDDDGRVTAQVWDGGGYTLQTEVDGVVFVSGDPIPADGVDCPTTHPVKGNIGSAKIYHVPTGSYYKRTTPEECFASSADAAAAGYRASSR